MGRVAARRFLDDLADELTMEGHRSLEAAADGTVPIQDYVTGARAPRPAAGSAWDDRRRFSAALRGWVRAAGLFAEALYADGGLRAPLEPGAALGDLTEAHRAFEHEKRALLEALYALDDLAVKVDRGWGHPPPLTRRERAR